MRPHLVLFLVVDVDALLAYLLDVFFPLVREVPGVARRGRNDNDSDAGAFGDEAALLTTHHRFIDVLGLIVKTRPPARCFRLLGSEHDIHEVDFVDDAADDSFAKDGVFVGPTDDHADVLVLDVDFGFNLRVQPHVLLKPGDVLEQLAQRTVDHLLGNVRLGRHDREYDRRGLWQAVHRLRLLQTAQEV